MLPDLAIALPGAGSLDPAGLFGAPRPIWLEVGFGGGEHMAWQAAANPEVGIIGCEPFVNGVVSALNHVRDGGLGNVRVWPDDARRLIDTLVDASIARAFLLFPDPWPKLRHHKRRFVSPENLDRMARVLADGAEFRMASDDPEYVRVMLEETRRHGAFAWTARRPGDWRERPRDWPATRYEEKARAAGRPPAFLSFLRIPRSAG